VYCWAGGRGERGPVAVRPADVNPAKYEYSFSLMKKKISPLFEYN